MISYYNEDKIVKLRIIDFHKSNRYVYKKQLKFLGIIFRQPGIYDKFTINSDDFLEELPKNHTIFMNNLIMENPEVVLTFVDKSIKRIFFEDILDATKYAKNLIKDKKWLEIIDKQ